MKKKLTAISKFLLLLSSISAIFAITFYLFTNQVHNNKSNLVTNTSYDMQAESSNSSNAINKDYKYKLTLTGKMPNAENDCTFIVLSNDKDLTFDQVSKSLSSSNSHDSLDIKILPN